MTKINLRFKITNKMCHTMARKVSALLFLFFVMPVSTVHAIVSLEWYQAVQWNSNTGTGVIGGNCERNSGGGGATRTCDKQLDTPSGKRLELQCWASQLDDSEPMTLNVANNTTSYKGWDVKFHYNGIMLTSTNLKTIYMESGRSGSGHTDYYINVSATYSEGHTIKPLKVSCILNGDFEFIKPENGISIKFEPPVSAAFSVKTVTTNVKHRTSEAGVHKYTLDFGKTVFNTDRYLKVSDYKCTALDSVSAKLSYTKADGQSLSNAELKTNGTIFYLQTDNPSSATLEIHAKKKTPGTYSCSMTLSQTVE